MPVVVAMEANGAIGLDDKLRTVAIDDEDVKILGLELLDVDLLTAGSGFGIWLDFSEIWEEDVLAITEPERASETIEPDAEREGQVVNVSVIQVVARAMDFVDEFVPRSLDWRVLLALEEGGGRAEPDNAAMDEERVPTVEAGCDAIVLEAVRITGEDPLRYMVSWSVVVVVVVEYM